MKRMMRFRKTFQSKIAFIGLLAVATLVGLMLAFSTVSLFHSAEQHHPILNANGSYRSNPAYRRWGWTALLDHHGKTAGEGRVPVPTYKEIRETLHLFLDRMHSELKNVADLKDPTLIWEWFRGMVEEILVPLDIGLKDRFVTSVRSDESIFVSVAAYRDSYCYSSMKDMFLKASKPEKLYVGLVQQLCLEDCKSGVLDDGETEDAPPDPNCHQDFCKDPETSKYCGNINALTVREQESLGPAFARYLASKLWNGETYFMQIDSHLFFKRGWDDVLRKMYQRLPTTKAVLSHYPPSYKGEDDVRWMNGHPLKMCRGKFADNLVEYHIVRIEGCRKYGMRKTFPTYSPFIAAGFFFAKSNFLKDIPFDPFLPWLFMGEELHLSIRFWTQGWDIFTPSENVCSHIYTRKHHPKFWETFNRLFKVVSHNAIVATVIQRVKHIIGYPEASPEMVNPNSLLDYLDLYGIKEISATRTLDAYLSMAGIDVVEKRVSEIEWCKTNSKPPYISNLRSISTVS